MANVFVGEPVCESEIEDEVTPRPATETDGLMKSKPKVNVENGEDMDEDARKQEENARRQKDVVTSHYNTRALSQHADTYELETFKKNALIIFNHVNVDTYEPRLGSDKDTENLKKTFELFNFEVEVCADYTKEKLFRTLEDYTARDFTDYGCVAVAVLTHGSDNGLLCAKDEAYYESEILELLKVDTRPFLVTKPKLVIIQACRGMKVPKAVYAHLETAGTTKMDMWKERPKPYTLPVEADTMVLHSSYMGYPSHRHIIDGSWLIEVLCEKISKLHDTTDFLTIVTKVQKEVSIHKYHIVRNRVTKKLDIRKQMPVVTSTLIRDLFLRKYEEISEEDLENAPEFTLKDEGVVKPYSRSQSMRCLCKLKHFDYISSCLRHYVDDHPKDKMAVKYVGLLNTFKCTEDFNNSKEEMVKLISDHFVANSGHLSYYKYLYLETSDDGFLSLH